MHGVGPDQTHRYDGQQDPACTDCHPDLEGVNDQHTTHLSVIDKERNMVSLTASLGQRFGAGVLVPGTGVVLNNGMMWFDPRPGRPNSIAPGRRPLSNMCPVAVQRGDGVRFAAGASGGRRIMAAVMQILSFLVDYRMSVEQAVHTPRIDVSGEGRCTVDPELDPSVAADRTSRITRQAKPGEGVISGSSRRAWSISS